MTAEKIVAKLPNNVPQKSREADAKRPDICSCRVEGPKCECTWLSLNKSKLDVCAVLFLVVAEIQRPPLTSTCESILEPS